MKHQKKGTERNDNRIFTLKDWNDVKDIMKDVISGFGRKLEGKLYDNLFSYIFQCLFMEYFYI